MCRSYTECNCNPFEPSHYNNHLHRTITSLQKPVLPAKLFSVCNNISRFNCSHPHEKKNNLPSEELQLHGIPLRTWTIQVVLCLAYCVCDLECKFSPPEKPISSSCWSARLIWLSLSGENGSGGSREEHNALLANSNKACPTLVSVLRGKEPVLLWGDVRIQRFRQSWLLPTFRSRNSIIFRVVQKSGVVQNFELLEATRNSSKPLRIFQLSGFNSLAKIDQGGRTKAVLPSGTSCPRSIRCGWLLFGSAVALVGRVDGAESFLVATKEQSLRPRLLWSSLVCL